MTLSSFFFSFLSNPGTYTKTLTSRIWIRKDKKEMRTVCAQHFLFLLDRPALSSFISFICCVLACTGKKKIMLRTFLSLSYLLAHSSDVSPWAGPISERRKKDKELFPGPIFHLLISEDGPGSAQAHKSSLLSSFSLISFWIPDLYQRNIKR